MVNKKVVIRVDGNSTIGLGHIYRGLALADMLKDVFVIEFVTRLTTTISPILGSGFGYTIIPEEVKFYNEPNWFKDNYSIETIIILDGYSFNKAYQQKIKTLKYKLVYVDDLALGKQVADLVINHSPGIKESDYEISKYTELALGLNYALLRKPFIEVDRKELKKKKSIKNLFISFGGADTHDFSLTAVNEVLKSDFIDTINIVLGAAYKNKTIFNLNNSKLKIHKNLTEQEVFKLMKDTDLAIVPASTTSIELASLGIPMILGYFVDNQKIIYNGFVQKDSAIAIGDFNKYKFNDLVKEIATCNKREILVKMQDNILTLFGGDIKDNILGKFSNLC